MQSNSTRKNEDRHMKYSNEFRQQAIKLTDEIGTQEAYRQFGIIYGTLADCRKARNRDRILAEEPDKKN